MKVGQQLPFFSLFNSNHELVNIHEIQRDSKLVIYFYPKNESRVCTAESCSFRDSYSEFLLYNIHVIGINKSSPEELKQFKTNHRLPFVLLSDPDYLVHDLFGVNHFLGFSGRETFLFDETGKLVYRYNNLLQGQKHVASVLKYIYEQ
ncbi:MAG: peroxiredoxin [Sediminibacterium sp.]